MNIIDNTQQTMSQALINALSSSDRVDIEVAFFYFSGWKLLAKHLINKKVRILVGKYIDPNAVPELLAKIKQEGDSVNLDAFQPRKTISSRIGKKKTYIEGFTRLCNESSLFDDSETQEAYRILENKIADCTLEIKLASTQEHGKMYILHNKLELSHSGDMPGTIFMGSSNFTFQGLQNQGELNERYSDKYHYEQYVEKFKKMWEDAENIEIASLDVKEDLLNQLEDELWIHAVPSPYSVYIRVLHEIFGEEYSEEVKTPESISHGRYIDLEYQIDAIKAVIDKLDRYDGVLLADVVGLGKSIIASTAANILNMNTLIIAPPHLQDQWEDYQEEFMLPGARVISSGKMEEVHSRYKDSKNPILIIVDEAHRFRNEDTNDYRMLHHVCTSHPDNKVILLTATPFNNDPKDVFALIKLFQIPGQSTIKSVDNLSLRFRELIFRYKKLNRDRRKNKVDQKYIDHEADEISLELRRLIENVVIRRSRLDLQAISRYRNDLIKQNIEFAKVIGPELLQYDLGKLLNLYSDTLLKITEERESGGFICARYKPTTYILESKREDFLKEYGADFDETDLKTAQINLAKFMKRLLVMRFESSKDAFRKTLLNMINSTELIIEWWEKLGKVPIMKKGQIPDPENILDSTSDMFDDELNQQTADDEIQKLKNTKRLIAVDKAFLDPSFIIDVKQDINLLKTIYENWFGNNASSLLEFDPKLDNVKMTIERLLSEIPNRKIVIFSSYADTVNYLYSKLSRSGMKRIMKYTAGDGGKEKKRTIRNNFDAGIKPSEQENNFDVIISTDALSEGYNLHRAGVIINYDIPYNPTRVVQRIGRINRINKKVFDYIFIYNCFPTRTGEDEIRIKQISTLKMRLINSVVGSDTKTLTNDEKLQSFFKDEFKKANSNAEELSWDAYHREVYDQAKNDKTEFIKALDIKHRSRVVREQQEKPAIVAFGKKGDHAIFALKDNEKPDPIIVPAEPALNYFKANKEDKGRKADKQYDEVFKLVRDLLFEKPPLPKISGRRSEALKVLKIFETELPRSKDFCRDLAQVIKKFDGINEGDLKQISQLQLTDIETAYSILQEIIPLHQITSISERARQLESEHETIVLSEELRT